MLVGPARSQIYALCKISLRPVSTAMYNNPYIARFKERSKVSPNFHKQTTGLTGLFVNEHPHHTLKTVYGRILQVLQKIPETAAYRKYTEEIVKRRLALVQQEPDIQKLEEKIGMGQIEEVIQQAEYELQTARSIYESKAWEPLVEEPPADQWKWPVA
uniref:Complex I subunit B13 n=1 Tax=Syphacia muris TaxID=451379 RepID=A0A0N5AA21_9BILA